MNNQLLNGFTLMEMLSALVIVCILAGFMLPNFQSVLEKQQADIVRNKLLTAMQLSQQEAYVKRVPIVMCANKNAHECSGEWRDGWIIFQNTEAENLVKDVHDIILINQMSAKGRIFWRTFPYSRDYLIFYPRSISNDSASTFWYCESNHALWSIVINKTGRIRTQTPDKNGHLYDSQNKLLTC